MKIEILEQKVATSRKQAQMLEHKAQQLGSIARTAKDKARKAKAGLKLARREVKQARRAAKEAKKVYEEALKASEAAAGDLVQLESKIKKATKKTTKPPTKRDKTNQAVARKPAVAKSRSQATKPVVAKPPSTPAAPAKPLVGAGAKHTPPVAPRKGSVIQVPRDFEAPSPAAPTTSSPKTDTQMPPGENPGN